ncbi:hypothetical protein GMORB2_5367 [Geosmithia morbida]|uniref:Uncharacterized protein n=1 Tax=Geosmithia morbida TaxID=1094350 RepID=A0A9P4YX51_9HYPO|nr:uncharacterized protein GMORB2_5367 [Geosmithia morbida]KAF4124701.1 hypothetical protein GMORB2_5367 [Geosmithia morbida]
MAATVIAPRYSNDDFETGSIRSAAPSYDPYLVGERAAEQARQERLSRERGDDILLQEDKRWDWMLAQMRTWDEREKAWSQFRREIQTGQRKRVLRHIGGRFP